MKKKAHYWPSSSMMDLTMDCMMPAVRLKGDVKKIYQRDTRLRLKRQTKVEIEKEE